MKNIIKLSLLAVGLAFTSCDVDQVGTKFIDGNRGVSFDNAKYTREVSYNDTELLVHVSRVSAAIDETIGITHNCTEVGIFTIPQTVSFVKGEYEKIITILIEPSNMSAGKEYSFDLTLEEKASFGGVNTTKITVLLELVWIPAGDALMASDWAGNSATVPVERAEGTNMYRLVSPYFYLEPEYCPEEGYHVVFIVDDSYNAVSIIPSDIGEEDGCTFTNVGNLYHIDGLFAYGKSVDDLTPGWWAHGEYFEWHR